MASLRVTGWSTCFACIAALSAAAAPPAQTPSDVVTWTGPETIQIKSTVMAPDACYSAGQPIEGAPAGAAPVENAVSVTFPLSRAADRMCAQVLTPISFSITAKAPRGSAAIIVYTVNSTAKTLSARALALPPPFSPTSQLSLQGVEWMLTHISGKSIGAPDPKNRPSITLPSDQPRFSGSGGCNRISGSYQLKGSTLTFGATTATQMACTTGMETETAFLGALGQVASWRISGRVLELLDARGQVVARFEGPRDLRGEGSFDSYSSRNADGIGSVAARIAGKSPPTSPMISA
jgi:heat shock protein HslJ